MTDERSVSAVFYVDVNSADESGTVGTTPESRADHGTNKVNVGDCVLAVDADDNACISFVETVGSKWLLLRMDESTWRPLRPVEQR